MRVVPFALGVWLAAAGPAIAQTPAELATEVQGVFARHCVRCHSNAETDYFDVRDLAGLKAIRDDDRAYIMPNSLSKSEIWEEAQKHMPPRRSPEAQGFGQPQREAIRSWILAGAPDFPADPKREPVPLEAMLRAIHDHAAAADPDAVPFLRYFTLANLHNNAEHVTADDLRATRAAVSVALNSLSWAQDVVVPEVVPGSDGTVLAVNIADLGWDRTAWAAIAAAYPYHVGYDDHDNPALKEIDARIARTFGNRAGPVHVRADWFVATATRPPLYHRLLYDAVLPDLKDRPADATAPANPKRMTARDLEAFLGVNVPANLTAKAPTAIRAGFPTSGVSGQNRLIERHPVRGRGAYWKSYDFKSSTWEANLQQFPLGPRFAGNPFDKLAFAHDGGEIIFHLPNGLQGYLLVDNEDQRIDAGPIEIVSDPTNISGTPVIVNGLSCMGCHKGGMRAAPADQIRDGKGVFGAARERVQALYPGSKAVDAAIEKDNATFAAALEKAAGPFLRGDDDSTSLAQFPESVSTVARQYYAAKADLDAATIAAELYLTDPNAVADKAATSDIWKRLGLGALADGRGRVKRGAWEAVRGTSLMQQAAREFGFTPR